MLIREEILNRKKIKSDGIWFLLASILSGIFFILFGIYELVFKSPLSSWFQGIWQSTLKASPQSLAELPNQIINTESLMQKTIGDWLGFVPGTFGQIWAIISSPAGAIAGLLLIILAVFIRLGSRFLFSQSVNIKKITAKVISWVALGSSFIPLLLEYKF